MLLVVHSIKDKGFPSPRAIITSWRYGELSNEELGHHEGRDEDDFVVDVHDLRRAHTGVNPYANEFHTFEVVFLEPNGRYSRYYMNE